MHPKAQGRGRRASRELGRRRQHCIQQRFYSLSSSVSPARLGASELRSTPRGQAGPAAGLAVAAWLHHLSSGSMRWHGPAAPRLKRLLEAAPPLHHLSSHARASTRRPAPLYSRCMHRERIRGACTCPYRFIVLRRYIHCPAPLYSRRMHREREGARREGARRPQGTPTNASSARPTAADAGTLARSGPMSVTCKRLAAPQRSRLTGTPPPRASRCRLALEGRDRPSIASDSLALRRYPFRYVSL